MKAVGSPFSGVRKTPIFYECDISVLLTVSRDDLVGPKLSQRLGEVNNAEGRQKYGYNDSKFNDRWSCVGILIYILMI